MLYLYLLLVIVSEVIGSVFLKFLDGFLKLYLIIIIIILYFIFFYFLSKIM